MKKIISQVEIYLTITALAGVVWAGPPAGDGLQSLAEIPGSTRYLPGELIPQQVRYYADDQPLLENPWITVPRAAGFKSQNDYLLSVYPSLKTLPTLFASLCLVSAAWSADTDAKDREQKVKATMAELQQHGFKEISENPELRRKWWDMVWKAFPQDPQRYNPDFTEFNKALFFDKPPAPRVHPRVFLRPETLGELRDAVKNDPAKARYFEIYKKNCQRLFTEAGPKQVFDIYLQRKEGPEADALVATHGYVTANYMLWESLRILVDDDQAAGQTLAKAVDHYAARLHRVYKERNIQEERFYAQHRALPDYMQDKVLGDKNYQDITGFFDQYAICFIYDFLYAYMSEKQRDNVRSLIAKLTENVWIHGMGIADTGGNWGPHHWKGAFAALTIEGEPGYDEDVAKGLRQVMSAYYMGDFTDAGMVWEGLGKGSVDPQGVIVAANRGWDLAANQNIRRAVSSALINSTLPDRKNMLALGGLGSSHRLLSEYASNAIILHRYYPSDSRFDYLLRIYLGEELGNLEYGRGFNHHYAGIHRPLFDLINISGYDREKSFEQAQDEAVGDYGTSFFCPEFAFLSTRSDWSKSAAWLGFTARSYNYGHTRSDRGMFTFAAQSRQWSIYPMGRGGDEWANSYAAQNASVMSIDQYGTLGEAARMVGYLDGPSATFATADIKHSWDWKTNSSNKASDAISPLTQAKMQPLHAGDDPHRDLSLSLYPHWLQPGQPLSPDQREPHFPVEHAFRTVGLVRHAQSYAMVMDDLKKDDETRLYTWHMTTEQDVVIEQQTNNTILLAETEGTRKLLIQVFDSANPDAALSVVMKSLWMGITGTSPMKQLQISSVASGVRFKVVLFAYDAKHGTPKFDAQLKGDVLTITHPGGVDRYDFAVDAARMSKFTAELAGVRMNYAVEHTPLPGRAPGAEGSDLYELK